MSKPTKDEVYDAFTKDYDDIIAHDSIKEQIDIIDEQLATLQAQKNSLSQQKHSGFGFAYELNTLLRTSNA